MKKTRADNVENKGRQCRKQEQTKQKTRADNVENIS
jgi:hypothetical protein